MKMIDANNQDGSIVTSLRRLIPNRPLTFEESRVLAELQASRLLTHLGCERPPFDTDLICMIPRIDVQFRIDLDESGKTTWRAGAWRIGIRATEPWVRQRFTIAHELKHVLDAPLNQFGCDDERETPGVEAICDHFAACVLMPKLWLKRAWGNGLQNVSQLARHFGVSNQAMQIRLQTIGLTTSKPRCSGVSPRSKQGTRLRSYSWKTYFRRSLATAVVRETNHA
ncbi:MAG: ImmA/IrrE family metallo-endopeptidase [Actinomycetota bacterium]